MAPRLYTYKSTEYEYINDKDLVELARDGDSSARDYLLNKYKRFVIAKSAPYFLVGGDKDDIIQEGMIGLLNAIRDYDRDKLTPFICFVEVCIKRQMITAIKKATRKKHGPLNSYISLNNNGYKEGSNRPLIEVLEEDKILDPMEVYIIGEELEKAKRKMDSMLSELEYKVLEKYLDGKTYEEISIEMDKDLKCIDNALQRVKKKFTKEL